MKTLKNHYRTDHGWYIWSCGTREKEMLLSKVDSLQIELTTSLKMCRPFRK